MASTLLEQVVAGQAPGLLPLTVDQYYRMIRLGILREGEATELIDGMLVRKDRSDRGGPPMAHGPRHALTIKRLPRVLRPVEELGFHLQSQVPVTLSATQEPEPDLAVVRGLPEDYADRHPGPGDVLVAVEVSDSTLEYDRTTKQRLYATAGIGQYWIVNLVENQVEVYDQPSPGEGRYGRRVDHQPGQVVRLRIGEARQVELNVADMVPPA